MTERRHFILVKPSPIVLPCSFGLRREPPRRPEDMQDDYLEKFDFTTLYYDVFKAKSSILGIGPPARNLGSFIDESVVRIDDAKANVEIVGLDRTQVTKFRADSAEGKVLSFEHELGSISCEIGENLEGIFQGRSVVVTKSRNNAISWIYDWARFYVANHKVTGLVLYDNNSTEYAPEDILEALRGVKGLEACVVVEWNYPWGSPGGVWAGNKTIPWDSDYCQYGAMEHARNRLLGRAQTVINHDVDELLVSEDGRAAGDLLKEMGVAGLEYSGRWIETIGSPTEGEPRFINFGYYDKNRGACTKKWVVNPVLAEGAKQWKLHSIEGLRLSKAEGLVHRHFMGISNNWKHNRTKPKDYDGSRHVLDESLAIAMNKAFAPEQGSDLLQFPYLNLERGSVNESEKDQKIVPHMPDAAVSALSERLRSARCYLEYGSGGSTVLAADLGVPRIISVDTNVEWFDKVKASVSAGYSGKLETLYVDIGPTKKWGYPVSNSHFQKWSKYFFEPWTYIRSSGLTPDLVLIDGRFRVSCFLTSLAHASVGTTLLFDDYANRKHYHAIERLLKPVNHYDRMAEFVKVSEPSAEALIALAAEFFLDTR